MSMPKVLLVMAIVLFGAIGLAFMKKNASRDQEVVLTSTETVSLAVDMGDKQAEVLELASPVIEAVATEDIELPDADRVHMLFSVSDPKAPVVKTITYKSRVPWLQGRPAWVADYARHYRTSRHFIARSLNGQADYLTQNVSNGDRFNVLDETKDVRFHVVVDVSRCRAWFYCYDATADERMLLKTYTVGLGRPDAHKASGCLTPLGTYELGERVATYKPKNQGWFNGEKVEMIRVFGTRWIPFEKEIANCSQPAKGFGVHGAPWSVNPATGELQEERACIGKFESDGCIRFVTEDIEELFSIVVSRPTTIEIVKSFEEAQLPGREVAL